jgi:hypothetical protein
MAAHESSATALFSVVVWGSVTSRMWRTRDKHARRWGRGTWKYSNTGGKECNLKMITIVTRWVVLGHKKLAQNSNINMIIVRALTCLRRCGGMREEGGKSTCDESVFATRWRNGRKGGIGFACTLPRTSMSSACWLNRYVRSILFCAPAWRSIRRPYENLGTNSILRKHSSYSATTVVICSAIFFFHETNEIVLYPEVPAERWAGGCGISNVFELGSASMKQIYW